MPEPNRHDQESEEAFAALNPASTAVRVARRQPRPAAGIVQVRVSGENDDVAIVLEILRAEIEDRHFEIISERGPYPNRRDPGLRMYLTFLLPGAAAAKEPEPGSGTIPAEGSTGRSRPRPRPGP